MVILVDSRVTHNFLSNRVAQEFGLELQAPKYSVVLRDDRKIKGVRQYEEVELTLSGLSMLLNFLSFLFL